MQPEPRISQIVRSVTGRTVAITLSRPDRLIAVTKIVRRDVVEALDLASGFRAV